MRILRVLFLIVLVVVIGAFAISGVLLLREKYWRNTPGVSSRGTIGTATEVVSGTCRIVLLVPEGKGLEDLPGITGTELIPLVEGYAGGYAVVHTWEAFSQALCVNADSRQPQHGNLWSGSCEGSVFHRGGVNMNLQGRDEAFWLQECSSGNKSALWAVWFPWAP